MKNQIKELRIKIDGLAQLTKELRPITEIYAKGGVEGELSKKVNSSQIEKAVDSLYLAKAWLGKVLEELGTETPYKNDSKRKTVEDIEPAADKANYIKTNTVIGMKDKEGKIHTLNNDKVYTEKSHIEKVDWLRQEIEKVASVILELNGGKLNKISFTECQEKLQWNSYTYLCEARFWLGFELQRIKENE